METNEFFGVTTEELSENLAYEIVQQMMESREPEEINFLETEKGRNTLVFDNNDANQRGRDWRSKLCKTKNLRIIGKPDCPPSFDENDESKFIFPYLFDMFDLEIPEKNNKNKSGKNVNGKCNHPLLCEGMTIVISKDGTAGAVCFNTNYKGKRKIHE